MAAQTIFTFLSVFTTTWIWFIILLFINGLGQISNFVAALVLGKKEKTYDLIHFSMMVQMFDTKILCTVSPFLFMCFSLFRCRDFHRECTCPVLIHGDMLWICCRLHVATSLCLLFEGLEISSLGSVCPLCGLHSPLVVCLTVFNV